MAIELSHPPTQILPIPAELGTLDWAEDAVAALAMFLPWKLEKKDVSLALYPVLLPKAFSWQAWPRYEEHAALLVVSGLLNILPAKLLASTSATTFWNTEPSTTIIAPESTSNAWPELAYQ